MLKVVKVYAHCENNDTMDFKLRDVTNGDEYKIYYCHRTDNPWFVGCLTKCFHGELYHNDKDLGPAFLQWVISRGWVLSYRDDNNR